MCRQLIYLISFVLVLGLALTSVAEGADPDLVGWWKLDDGSGNTATDSSVNDNHGIVYGAQWIEGQIGDALLLDGTDDYVDLPIGSLISSLTNSTFAIWVDFSNEGGAWQRVWDFGSGASVNMFLTPRQGTAGTMRFAMTIVGWWDEDQTTAPATLASGWHHVAVTIDADNNTHLLYLDGEVVAQNTATRYTPSDLGETTQNWLGRSQYAGDAYFDGSLDDFYIFGRVLTQQEIADLMEGLPEEGPKASNPSPTNGDTDVCRDTVLSWTPVEYAPPTSGHKVFFSDDFNDVNQGLPAALQTDPVEGTPQDSNMYPTTGTLDLDFGTTYYWRIDEANSTAPTGWDEGNVWRFTTEPFGYPIENITATASSEYDINRAAENTVNESGLDVNDGHSIASTDMWLSYEEPTGAQIEYEFDKVYTLHQMWVWNFNDEFNYNFGIKDVSIAYSINGTDWTPLGSYEFARATGKVGYAHDDYSNSTSGNNEIDLSGVIAKYIRLTATSTWGGGERYGLSEVRFYHVPLRARKPSPELDEPDVDLDAVLNFRAGREAAEHKLYLGTDEQAVKEGSISPVSIPVSGCETSYDPPGSLDLDQSYYWRIDEVNMAEDPNIWQGDTWNFTTLEYLVVDDMEDYDANDKPIWCVWEDGMGYGSLENPPLVCGNGTGSAVGDEETGSTAEETIVYGGRRSMPYKYVNDGSGKNICGDPITVYYSKAERTFDEPQDWENAGIKTLTLYFYGDPDNYIGDPMWVELTDQSDDSGKVTYGSYADEDVNNLAYPFWHEWNIELVEFGIDLNGVNSIAIGFGEPGATSPGGKGTIYFDDVQLYPSRCVSSRRKPAGDLDNDCDVDYNDVIAVGGDWLVADYTANPLMAWYKFDDGSGTVAADSSGNGNNGTVQADPPLWVTGQIGGALQLDGIDDYVELPIGSLINSLTSCTFTTWVDFSSAEEGDWQRIFDFGSGTAVYMFLSPRIEADGPMRFAITTVGGAAAEEQIDAPDTLASGWHHVAVMMDAKNGTHSLYLDGLMVGQNTEATLSPSDLGETTQNWLGRSQWTEDAYFNGTLDDFRIYDKVLLQAELASIMDGTLGSVSDYHPVPSPAELYSSEPVNSRKVDLKDYAVLADTWLDELRWP